MTALAVPARFRVGAALGAVLLALDVSSADDRASEEGWPQWRGPFRDAHVRNVPPWPDDLSSLERIWRVEMGPGYSGPVVWGNRVFVTETRAARDEVVWALDRNDGRKLWQVHWPGALSVPFFAKRNGDWIRATPACDGESLFVAGMRDVLVCLDAEKGAQRWKIDFPERFGSPVPSFGFVCSPLVVGDFVYVQAGGSFVKVNKRTGDVAWRVLTDGGGMNSAFSSPFFTSLAGVPQLVVQTREKLVGVSPETGEEFWSQVVPAFRGMNILTPTVFDGGVFTSSYKNRTFYYRVDRKDAEFRVEEGWSLPAQGYMSSPVVIDGFAYLHLGNGRLCCIDLKEGKERWRTTPFGQYWSMAANRDRILALDQKGELLLIAADPREFRLLDRREVASSEAWAHVAVAGDDVLVRDLKGISAFRWPRPR